MRSVTCGACSSLSSRLYKRANTGSEATSRASASNQCYKPVALRPCFLAGSLLCGSKWWVRPSSVALEYEHSLAVKPSIRFHSLIRRRSWPFFQGACQRTVDVFCWQ